MGTTNARVIVLMTVWILLMIKPDIKKNEVWLVITTLTRLFEQMTLPFFFFRMSPFKTLTTLFEMDFFTHVLWFREEHLTNLKPNNQFNKSSPRNTIRSVTSRLHRYQQRNPQHLSKLNNKMFQKKCSKGESIHCPHSS